MANSGKLPARTPLPENDLASMDDPEFLAVCRRVRTARETTPHDEVSPDLATQFEAVNREFMRRAGMAWQRVS
jgi:hypothetical protein